MGHNICKSGEVFIWHVIIDYIPIHKPKTDGITYKTNQ